VVELANFQPEAVGAEVYGCQSGSVLHGAWGVRLSGKS
jgi:hypothetical protein